MARVALVGMWQETNTYSARVTTLADFERFELLAGAALLDHHRGAGSVIGGFLDGLEEAALEPVGVLSAGAWPGGPPDAATTAALLARLERALAETGDCDAVLVNLHGAMVADGASDMEAETLRRVRERFGAVPLAAVLDLHANLSPQAAARCDAIVGYRTYPHVDMRACGREAAALVASALGGASGGGADAGSGADAGAAGGVPVTAYGKLAALTSPVAQGTDDEPMRGLLARAEARAAAAGALRVSLLPGFPYSDVARAGFGVAVTAPAGRARVAQEVVAATLADVEAALPAFVAQYDPPERAVARALESAARPVVLADLADNVGGGGPGDGTALLAALVEARAAGAVVTVVDAEAVRIARAAGAGAAIEVALGGRTDDLHGAPVHVRARVVRLGDGDYVSGGSYMTGQRFSMGATAVLEVEQAGVTVLAMERATPPFHLEQLTSCGIDPAGASMIALKGAVAWRAPYAAVAAAAIEVDTPGCCPADPYRLPRTTAPAAVDPFTTTGVPS